MEFIVLYFELSLYLYFYNMHEGILDLCNSSCRVILYRRAFPLCDIETRTRAKVADDATRRPSVKTKPGNFDPFYRKNCRCYPNPVQ